MRNGQNKRMRGRNRNHKSNHSSDGGGGGGGGGHHHNPLTRVYESNGPEVKIRGTAHHVAEKYLQLARDAQGSGDPVTAENHYQHAEHYLRLIAAAQEQFRQQNPYYQAPPAPGDDHRRRRFEDGERAMAASPGRASRCRASRRQQGQPNFGNQQNFNNPQNFNSNQQPPYPPREQPQPYGGQQPNSNYQGRPQHQPQQNQPYSPPQPLSAAAGAAVRWRQRCRATAVLHHRHAAAAECPERRAERPRQPERRRRPFPASPPARHRGPGGPRPDLRERAAGFPRRRRLRRAGQQLDANRICEWPDRRGRA